MKPKRPRILIVDDQEDDGENARSLLELCNYEVVGVTDAAKALSAARSKPFDTLLISIDLPDDGFALSQELREIEGYEDIPIIFITGEDFDEATLMEALYYGALDFLHKPYNAAEFLARVATMVRIKQLQDELKERMADLDRLASTDPLTGLYNRRFFFQRMDEELARAARGDHPLCLLYIDIDHFKLVNDTFGHNAGDTVLKQLSRIFSGMLRKSDVLGRVGGEEFLILLPESTGHAGNEIAERLRERVAHTSFAFEKQAVRITISVGAYFAPDPLAIGVDEIVQLADQALYEAKEKGRDQVVYQSGLPEEAGMRTTEKE